MSPIREAVADDLCAIVVATSDATVPIRGSSRAVAPGLLSKKESFVAAERDTPEHREQYRQFCEVLALTKPERLVFIDESFCRTGMRREYGWAA